MHRSPSIRRSVSRVAVEGLEGRRLFAYTVTDLAPDTNGVVHTGKAYGISNDGKIAMQYDGKAAYWQNGVVHNLGFAGYANDINDAGVVVGVDTSSGQGRPFVWKNGTKTNPTLNGRTLGYAAAVNESGTVVGTFYSGQGIDNNGFVMAGGGSATNIGAPSGFQHVDATGVNDKGQIIGNVYSFDTGYRAFIRTSNTFKLLGPLPGGASTGTKHGIQNDGTIAIDGPSADFYSDGTTKVYHAYTVGSNGYGAIVDRGTYNNSYYDVTATDINTAGVITATNNQGLNDSQGMVNTGGLGFTRLDDLGAVTNGFGWHFASADAVNDSGKVVGFGYNPDGQLTPYLLSPPAPATHTLSGVLWNDTDGDGQFDGNESNSGVRTVYLDQNQNNKLDNGEKSVQSNANGGYQFNNLADGTYYVTRVFPSGYSLSNGTNGGTSVKVPAFGNSQPAGINLGSKPSNVVTGAKITGTVFNDTDKDGVFDGNESNSGVRTVFIDTNGNKKLDSGEKSTQSNASGVYSFTGLNAGTYKITRVFPSGYKLSNNSNGYLSITVSAGQTTTGVNLGSKSA